MLLKSILFFGVFFAFLNAKVLDHNIIWSSEKKFEFDFKDFYYQDGNFFAKEIKFGKKHNFYQAQNHCKNLKIKNDGINFDIFRLPKRKEMYDIYVDYKIPKVLQYKFFWNDLSDICKYDKKNEKAVLSHFKKSSYSQACYLKKLKNKYNVYKYKTASICLLESSSMSLNSIAKKLYDKKVKKLKTSTLKKPLRVKNKKLVKGEFEKTKTFEKRVKIQKDKIEKEYNKILSIYNKEVEKTKNTSFSKDELFIISLEEAFYLKYGRALIKSVKYDADLEVFLIKIISSRSNYSKDFKIKVPLSYAKKFKKILLEKDFKVSLLYEYKNDTLVFKEVLEFIKPTFLVQKVLYSKIKKIKSKKQKLKDLESFQKEYKNSLYKKEIKKDIKVLKEYFRIKKLEYAQRKKIRIKKQKQNEVRIKNTKIRKQKSYKSRKNIGDLLCLQGKTAIILPITIKGFVQRVNKNKIEIRISNTQATYPIYNGVKLYPNSLLWDNYTNWYKCDF